MKYEFIRFATIEEGVKAFIDKKSIHLKQRIRLVQVGKYMKRNGG